jgi:hypothetical protein
VNAPPSPNPSLREAVCLVDPFIADVLLPTESREKIRGLAGRLAPVYWAGYEFHLGGGPVDFTQGIDGPQFMDRVLQAPESVEGGRKAPGWRRIAAFGRQWAAAGTFLNRSISRIGLEFDLHANGAGPPVPALFVEVRRPGPLADAKKTVNDGIFACLEILKPGFPASMAANIRHCISECPDEAFIYQFGAMLSRPINALRLNIGGLAGGLLPGVLQRTAGLRTNRALASCIDALAGCIDRFVLCLDVGERFGTRVGIECLPSMEKSGTDRWGPMLSLLVDMGLCRREEKNAILDWPGIVEPFTADTHWPEDLLIESLKRSSATFSVFRREINHVKIDWRPDRPLRAKVYFQFYHQWERAGRVAG